MKPHLFRLALLVLTATLFLAGPAGAAEAARPFAAVIVDSNSNKALSGATLELQRIKPAKPKATRALSADRDGKITAALPPGTYRYHARHKGYVAGSGDIHLPGESRTLLLPLDQAASISGRVIDDKGSPVPGLRLVARNQSGVSDDAGRFRIDGLPRGPVEVSASHPILALEFGVGVDLAPGEQRNIGDLRVLRGGMLALSAFGREDGKVQPLPRLRLYLHGRNGERSATTDAKGEALLQALPPGTYRVSCYDDRITAFPPREIEVRGGEQSQARLETEMRRPELDLESFGDVLLPEKQVKVRVNGFRVSRAKVTLSSIDPALLMTEEVTAEKLAAAAVRKKIRGFDLPMRQLSNFHSRALFNLPPLQPGAYLLELDDAAGRGHGAGFRKRRGAQVFLVTRLALVTKNSPTGTLIYAADLVTGKPVSGVEVSGSPVAAKGTGKSLFQVKSGADGLASVGAPPGGTLLVGRWQNNYAKVVITPERQPVEGGVKGYIYSDRPAYRPGQTVFFKGIVRKRDGEGYQIPQPQKVQVVVTDNNDQSVFEHEYTTSASGSFHGEYLLPAKPPLGYYSISARGGNDSWSAGFRVLEYRKPEFEVIPTAAQKFVLAGDRTEVKLRARYYFGAPVAAAAVKYRVYSREAYGFADEGADSDYGEEGGGYADLVSEGELRSDAGGEVVIPLETQGTSVPLVYTVETEVTDLSSRQVSAATSFNVVPALINVTVRSEGYVVTPGKPVEMTIKAATWEGAPVKAGFRVKVEEEVWDKKQIRSFREVDTVEAATDVTGEGSFRYHFPRPGYWRVTAATTDSRGRQAKGEGWVWAWRDDVAQEGYYRGSGYRQLGLVFDKKSYHPGDTAKLLVKSPAAGHLLLSVEGREVYSRRIIALKGTIEVIEIPVPKEYAPYVFVSASLIRNGRFYSRTRKIKVDDKPGLLNVAVAPQQGIYAPGERARVSMTVTGAGGEGRAAELSLGVVDEAIYAIARERGDDLYSVFRGSRDHLVSTLHSFPQLYLGGAAKDDGNASEQGQPNRVRRVFKDTAYWLPVLESGADGKASAEFDLPDNLTTWRATVLAHNAASEFGSGTGKFISRLDVMARLLPPRFLVQGDEVKIPAMINNVTDGERQVKGSFTVQGVTVAGESSFSGSVPANGSLRRDLPVRGANPGEALIRLDATAGAKGDAMELPIPVLPRGLKRQALGNILLREAGSAGTTIQFPQQAFAEGAQLSVDFAPSLAAALKQGIRELVEFPYGCVEQTMSRFLPAVYVQHLAQEGKWPVDRELSEKLPQVLDAGLNRLYDFQHTDGGWGWWKEDSTDLNMTADVVYGLSVARKAGVELKDEAYQRGVQALAEMLAPAATSQLPYAYRALTMNGASDPKVEERIEQRWKDLQPSEQILYVEALLNRGQKERAQNLLEGIKSRVQRDGTAAWLQDPELDSWWYSERWGASPVETTAMLLESVLRLDSKDPLAPSLAEFLLRKRAGRWWQTTRATAEVIKALADFGGEPGDYSARILLNGREVERLTVERGEIVGGKSSFAVAASELRRGANLLQMETTGGRGGAHLAAIMEYIVPPELAQSTPGLSIKREILRVTPRRDGTSLRLERTPLRPDEQLAPGDELEVRLIVENGKQRDYVIIEDPLPAGFEVKETAGDSRFEEYGYGEWYAHRERHDERMAFFLNTLSPGQHEFRYLISPQMEGKMLALPASLWPMYQPSVRSESSPWEVTVIRKGGGN